MKKFYEISKINSHNETGKALINLDDVVGIKENHTETTKLYDDNGNLVSETPNPKSFTLKLATGIAYHIDENQYNELVKVLTQTETDNQ